MKIENDTSDCAVLFLRSFRVQNWCKFGAKTYRTMQKLCNDMRRKRHKIAQNERFSTIFRGINASRKTPRDNFLFLRIIFENHSTHFGGCCFFVFGRGDLWSPAGERSSPLRCMAVQFVKTLPSYLLFGNFMV